jgi:hypothetical protein
MPLPPIPVWQLPNASAGFAYSQKRHPSQGARRLRTEWTARYIAARVQRFLPGLSLGQVLLQVGAAPLCRLRIWVTAAMWMAWLGLLLRRRGSARWRRG